MKTKYSVSRSIRRKTFETISRRPVWIPATHASNFPVPSMADFTARAHFNSASFWPHLMNTRGFILQKKPEAFPASGFGVFLPTQPPFGVAPGDARREIFVGVHASACAGQANA
jgi:hypothetical protein